MIAYNSEAATQWCPRKECSENMQKFTGEYDFNKCMISGDSCGSMISIKLQSNFIEIELRHGCSPVNLLDIFRTPFLKNSSGWLLLNTLLIVTYSISCLKGRIAPYALNIFSNFCKVQENVPFCILPENGVL